MDSNPWPEATSLETKILGGLMFLAGSDTPLIDIVLQKLEPAHFYLTRHAKVYRAIQKIHGDGRPADMMTVIIEMARAEPSKVDGLQQFIADELMENASMPGMIDAYANIVIEKAYRRDVIRRSVELVDLASDQTHDSAEILDHIESKILALLTRKKGGGRALADSMPEKFAELEAAVSTGVMPGIPTGFDDLNTILNGGARRGQLIVIAGRPAMGKSALAVGNMLPYIASVTNQTSLIFSLEMSEEELIHRFWASQMSRPHTLSHLDLADRDWQELGQIVSDMSDLKIIVDDTPKVSIDYIRSEARRQKAQNGALGCIMIDYLQIMDLPGGNPAQTIGQITSSLKALAKELDTPVFLLSQLSRGVESRENKRPLLSDLRDSGSIEQDANIVMFLYRDDYYNDNSENPGVTEVIVSKNRGGAKGTVELLFDGPRTTFSAIGHEPQRFTSLPKTFYHPSPAPAAVQSASDVDQHLRQLAKDRDTEAPPIIGFAVDDRVVVTPPNWFTAAEEKESRAAKEAPYGELGTVKRFVYRKKILSGDMEPAIEVRLDSGTTRNFSPDYLQSDTDDF